MATPGGGPRVDVFSLEEEYPAEPAGAFYHMEFRREIERDVSACWLRAFLGGEAGGRVEGLTTDSGDGFRSW